MHRKRGEKKRAAFANVALTSQAVMYTTIVFMEIIN